MLWKRGSRTSLAEPAWLGSAESEPSHDRMVFMPSTAHRHPHDLSDEATIALNSPCRCVKWLPTKGTASLARYQRKETETTNLPEDWCHSHGSLRGQFFQLLSKTFVIAHHKMAGSRKWSMRTCLVSLVKTLLTAAGRSAGQEPMLHPCCFSH